MVKVKLRGVAKVRAKGRAYWYAWRGGPRLRGEPGSPEFMASYNEAIENRRLPEPGRFRALVTLYRASPDFQKLADSTKRNWSPWLDRIAEYFGDLSIAQFDRPERIRPVIRRWRHGFADKPRSADYGMQVLSRVLSYGVDPLGKIGATLARALNKSTAATAPRSSGPTPISRASRRRAARRSPTRLTLHLIQACGSATYCACHGHTSVRMPLSSRPAKASIAARRSSRCTMI